MSGKETLEQAVKRVATKLHSDLGDGLSVSQEYWRLEAALREMAAWAYRDAAHLIQNEGDCPTFAQLHRYFEGKMSLCGVLAEGLERRAAAIRQGE